MLRSSFFSAGLFIAMWGGICLVLEKVELKSEAKAKPVPQQTGFRGFFSRNKVTTVKEPNTIKPPEWAAFTLLSIGAVTMLYAVALPKKKQQGD